MSRAVIAPLWLWIATSPLACQSEPTEGAPSSPTPPSPEPPPPEWHYAPALQAGTPADVTAAPVFELADGRTGEATIAVAVARVGAPPRLEVWRFSQNNPRARLERVGDPLELQALDGTGGREVLEEFRRAIAQPGNEYVRPRGLAVAPEELFRELVRLGGVIRDSGAAPRDRADALARVTLALDDSLLFERGLLPALLQGLASGDWGEAGSEALGERRRRVTLRAGHRFVVARTGERWVLSEATLAQSSEPSAPAAEPSPTAP